MDNAQPRARPSMDPADRRFFESLREAPLAGDILLHFHGSTFDGRPRTPSDLPNQVALLYRLIEHFGPNQVVGVPAFVLDDPLGSSAASRALFPETLHSCLALPYILRFILIHRVPESSLPPLDFFPEVVKRDRSGWVGRSFDFRWPVFQRYRASSSLHTVAEERDASGRFLFNGAPYSQRPVLDHRVQPPDLPRADFPVNQSQR